MTGSDAVTDAGARHQEHLCRGDRLNGFDSLRLHWPEYLMEAGEVGIYLFFTCVFAALLRHPSSPIRHFFMTAMARRGLMGLAIGATVAGIVLTPWGKQSGGHFNPAITFTFYSLGRVAVWDAVFYAAAQFAGAAGGVAVAAYVLRVAPGDTVIRYAVTVPGVYGNIVAFAAELTISFGLMITILFVTNHEAVARYTPFFVGALYAVYITFETPLSGMSMNPARTFGPAFEASYWHALWIYFLAPTLGMLIASGVFLRLRGGVGPYCAKLHHANNKRCIFRHGYRTAHVHTP
jgi:aquaporin Z